MRRRGGAWVLLLPALVAVTGCRLRPQTQAAAPPVAPPPPAASVPDRDVVYGTVAGQPLRLDVYRCPKPGRHPAVVMIHGGGWYSGDKLESQGPAARLVDAGFTCFAINYRLTPQFHYPAQVRDCAQAVRWVRAHADEYRVDPARVGAWGDSAGAHLALMLGAMAPGDFIEPTDPNRRLNAKAQCVVDFYGPAEFRPAAHWPLVAMRAAYGFFGGWSAATAAVRTEASPVARVTQHASPVLLIHGERDLLVPLQQSQLMQAALQRAGVANQLITVPGAGHALAGATPEQRAQTTEQAIQWLQEHLAN